MTLRDGAPSLRKRARRLGFGLATLLGGRPLGFFIPYRHAASAAEPTGYPALEPAFRAAEASMLAVLAAIEDQAASLLAIARSGIPDPRRPRLDQDWFPRLDAAAAYGLVRDARPARILEIGSGHSTRFLARAVADGGLPTAITCIDPAPRAPLPDGVTHAPRLLDASDSELAGALAAGDMLFVDSSHVAMPGTDLDLIVGHLLPRLAPGVLLHLHDVLLPDPYPAEWAWRGYNEAIVAAALIASGGFELVFASRWAATRLADKMAAGILAELPLRPGAHETSLWLRKR